MSGVCLLLIDDGRADYYERATLALAELAPAFDETVQVLDHSHDLGFAGAIAEGWARVKQTGCEWVLHWESDFVPIEPVPMAKLVALLMRRPHLAQVSLLRQPWNERERAAGGIVAADPADFTDCHDGEASWVEHRRYFTTNPSVYSVSLCSLGWPEAPESEGRFTHRLLTDPSLRFAIWGARDDPPRVMHIGEQRAGHGY